MDSEEKHAVIGAVLGFIAGFLLAKVMCELSKPKPKGDSTKPESKNQ